MRFAGLFLLCLFLVACVPQPEGKGLLSGNKTQDREQTAMITGQVIGDIYNEKSCLDDSDCGPSQTCVDSVCVVG